MKKNVLALAAVCLITLGIASANAGSVISAIVDLASQVQGTLPVANGGTGDTTTQGALNSIMNTTSGTASFVVVNCTGSHDEVAFAAAEEIAYTTKTSILIPPAKASGAACQLDAQWKLTHPSVSVFAWPNGPTSDPKYQEDHLTPYIRVVSENIEANVANKCAIDLNGQASVTFENVNIRGTKSRNDSSLVAICNTVNGGSYPNSGLATLNLFNVSIHNFGTAVGCAISTVDGKCTGTLGNNLITVRASNSIFSDNGWAFNGNIGSDLFLINSELGNNYWAAISAWPSGGTGYGGAGAKIIGNRFEYNGKSGTTYSTIELGGLVAGSVVSLNEFDSSWNADIRTSNKTANITFTGNSHRKVNLSNNAATDTYYLFEDSVAGSGHFSITGENFDADVSHAPANLMVFAGSKTDYVSFTGFIGGATAYTSASYAVTGTAPTNLTVDGIGTDYVDVGRISSGYVTMGTTGIFGSVASIPNTGLTNSVVTLGTTTVALGSSSASITGLSNIEVAAGASGISRYRPYISGNYYMHGLPSGSPSGTNTTVFSNDYLYTMVGNIAAPVTIDTVSFATSTSNASSGATAKICVYNMGVDGKPNALVGQTTTGIAIGDSAVNTAYTGTLDAPVTLSAGIYYFGILTTSTTTGFRSWIGWNLPSYTIMGTTTLSSLFNYNPISGYKRSATYTGGCPNPFGSSTAITGINETPVMVFHVQ